VLAPRDEPRLDCVQLLLLLCVRRRRNREGRLLLLQLVLPRSLALRGGVLAAAAGNVADGGVGVGVGVGIAAGLRGSTWR
jgi:hypothetical protein